MKSERIGTEIFQNVPKSDSSKQRFLNLSKYLVFYMQLFKMLIAGFS